ncbi:MAG: hypothetical protein JWM21_675 [Acidobacteria bacterium]|nr:hypothetical protein [Acidobacteriota bacterium]
MNRGQQRAQWLARNRMRMSKQGGVGLLPMYRSVDSERAADPRSAGVNSVSAHRSLTLHIGELVLHGFPSTSRYPIGDATQKELVRLISHGGLPLLQGQGDSSRADAGSFQVTPGAGTRKVGGLIARALYGGRQR